MLISFTRPGRDRIADVSTIQRGRQRGIVCCSRCAAGRGDRSQDVLYEASSAINHERAETKGNHRAVQVGRIVIYRSVVYIYFILFNLGELS